MKLMVLVILLNGKVVEANLVAAVVCCFSFLLLTPSLRLCQPPPIQSHSVTRRRLLKSAVISSDKHLFIVAFDFACDKHVVKFYVSNRQVPLFCDLRKRYYASLGILDFLIATSFSRRNFSRNSLAF